MKGHELATLNETREENIALKKTCDHLRKRNDTLLERNVALKFTAEGTALALDAYMKAVRSIGGSKLMDEVTQGAKALMGAEPKKEKKAKKKQGLFLVPRTAVNQ